jgi:glutamyl-tRNA synthetase
MEEIRKTRSPIIQWVGEDHLSVEVRSPEGTIAGIGETAIAGQVDKIVQFERFGFCRIDSAEGKNVVAYFAHR